MEGCVYYIHALVSCWKKTFAFRVSATLGLKAKQFTPSQTIDHIRLWSPQ